MAEIMKDKKVLREQNQSKEIDLERSSYVGQINESENANVKFAFLNGVLLSVIMVKETGDLCGCSASSL